jgi:minor extracellular serine protease Vpr
MKLLWALCIAVTLSAANVSNRYIVELTTEPVARIARNKAGLHSAAAEQHRRRIRAEQTTIRARIQQAEGVVTGAVENLRNALVVRIDDAKAARLASLPGVRKVYPVRTFHLTLDHALPLHRVPDAWAQVGIGNAGAGARIGILDSGVDIGHPGFRDAGFTAPDGFPRGDANYTNNKVIVARSYVAMLPNRDPDLSPADHVGHGTATAMAAAGISNTGPLATVSGVAPRAFIGSYKVFGSPSVNATATEDAILAALDDAVADGMDVINLSFGNDVALSLSDDPEVQAIEAAAGLGIVVVCSAGNNGGDPMTVATPAAAPSVIAVGATANDRIFSARAVGPDGTQLQATAASGSEQTTPLTAPLLDVKPLDGDGLACGTLPDGALAGSIALISRGTCTFEIKLNNAQAAGAVAALVYDNLDEALITMGVGAATLPGEMVSMADGLALQRQLAAPLMMTLDFALPFFADPTHLESFSAAGPNIDFSIKPDMVAVGGSVYTAAEKIDPKGLVYNSSGYGLYSGTSFSAPLVAGAAALLKSARPGLTAAQYRSLLVDTAAPASSAPGTQAHIQQAGAGMLDMLAALNATAAVAPVSLSFGRGGGSIHDSRNLTLWNVGTVADTFQIAVASLGGNAVPELPFATVQLDPGAAMILPVSFSADGLAPGAYEGFIQIQGSRSNITTRVPYWYGVAPGLPRHITVLQDGGPTTAGASNALLFRVTDDAGLPVLDKAPDVSAVSGGGEVLAVGPLFVPFAYGLTFRLGPRPGANVFRIQVGELTKDLTVIGQ